MILEDNPFGASILNDLLIQKLSLIDFTSRAEERNVHVVQPNEVITTEIRTDNSRYFPEVDNADIVIGGSFH